MTFTSTLTTTVPASIVTAIARQGPFYVTAQGGGLTGQYAEIVAVDTGSFRYARFSAASQESAARWFIDANGSLFSEARSQPVGSVCGDIPLVSNRIPDLIRSRSCDRSTTTPFQGTRTDQVHPRMQITLPGNRPNGPCSGSTKCTIVSESGQCRLACIRSGTYNDGAQNFNAFDPDGRGLRGAWALGSTSSNLEKFTPFAVAV
jgi:hypothetical protein